MPSVTCRDRDSRPNLPQLGLSTLRAEARAAVRAQRARRWTIGWGFIGLSGLLLVSCAASILPQSLLEFGRNMLVTANTNHGARYREDVNRLIMSMSRQWVSTPYPVRRPPPPPPAPPPQTGMPGMPFPPGGYPPPVGMSPPMPSGPVGPPPMSQSNPAMAAQADASQAFPAADHSQMTMPGHDQPAASPPPTVVHPAEVHLEGPAQAGGAAHGFDPAGASHGAPTHDPAAHAGVAGESTAQASATGPSTPLPVDPSAQVVPRGLPLGMGVAVLRARPSAQGDEIALIADGDVLRDGHGAPAAGDKIKIVLRPESACYVYVVGIDGSGLVRSLFAPAAGEASRPVMPNRDYTIPQGREWAALDEVRGVETLYLIASPEPRPDLDQALNAFEVRPRSIGPITAKVEEPAILPADHKEMERGRPASIELESGRLLHIPLRTYVAAQAGEALRLTRWFRHE